MEQASVTALVSAFSRWYHAAHNEVKVFDDAVAGDMLTEEEKTGIASNMAKGIEFFNPAFIGSEAEALRWIVDNQLSPTPLGRAVFAEKRLEMAMHDGVKQYLILAAGYDTFAYRQPVWASEVEIFEIDHPATAADKRARLRAGKISTPENTHYIDMDFNKEGLGNALHAYPGYVREKTSFCSLLGISYYLEKPQFSALLHALAVLMPAGSSIAFDYPDQDSYTERAGIRAQKQAMLARGANEKMLASYAIEEIEAMLAASGFLPVEHMAPKEITDAHFAHYNAANPEHPIYAFDNVNYCVAVKR